MRRGAQSMLARLIAAALLAMACAPAGVSPADQTTTEQAEQQDGGAMTVMTGRVVWQGGDAQLPDGAVLTVTLADTSIADAAWTVISQQVIEDATQLPAAFRLEYDPTKIDERSEYTLSASVDLGDQLLYTNDTVHTVLTRGAPAESDIEVIAVR